MKLSQLIRPADGVYEAISGGYETKFLVNETLYKATFGIGVKGFNIPDSVTVKDGEVTSKMLGVATSVSLT